MANGPFFDDDRLRNETEKGQIEDVGSGTKLLSVIIPSVGIALGGYTILTSEGDIPRLIGGLAALVVPVLISLLIIRRSGKRIGEQIEQINNDEFNNPLI